MQLLHRRCILELQDTDTVDLENTDYCFGATESYLDYILVVGNVMGIDMFIPNVATNFNFALELNLHLQIKQFKAKHGTLGFNPTGCMLCIAQSPTEDYWLAFPPQDYFVNQLPEFTLDKPYADSRLSTFHYRIVMLFLSFVLTKLPGHAYYLLSPYRCPISDPEFKFGHYTNAL